MKNILARIKAQDPKLIDEIDSWTYSKRIEVRELAKKLALPLPRNLYWDYKHQCWIGEIKLQTVK